MRSKNQMLVVVGIVAVAAVALPILLASTNRVEPRPTQPAVIVPQNPSPAISQIAPWLAKAMQALAQGRYELAIQCCINQIDQHTETAESTPLLWQAIQKQQEAILADVPKDLSSRNPDDRHKIRKPFEQAAKILADLRIRLAGMLEAREQRTAASLPSMEPLVSLVRQLEAAEKDLAARRYATFSKYSDAFLEQAKKWYQSGKGEWEWHVAVWQSAYEWCDNDEYLMNAVETLEYASSVMNELRASDRTTLANWRDKVRDCLSSAKFDNAHQRAKIVLGERE